jgi:hypothetical protein
LPGRQSWCVLAGGPIVIAVGRCSASNAQFRLVRRECCRRTKAVSRHRTTTVHQQLVSLASSVVCMQSVIRAYVNPLHQEELLAVRQSRWWRAATNGGCSTARQHSTNASQPPRREPEPLPRCTGAGGDKAIAKLWNRREISVSSYDDQSHNLYPHQYLRDRSLARWTEIRSNRAVGDGSPAAHAIVGRRRHLRGLLRR